MERRDVSYFMQKCHSRDCNFRDSIQTMHLARSVIKVNLYFQRRVSCAKVSLVKMTNVRREVHIVLSFVTVGYLLQFSKFKLNYKF